MWSRRGIRRPEADRVGHPSQERDVVPSDWLASLKDATGDDGDWKPKLIQPRVTDR